MAVKTRPPRNEATDVGRKKNPDAMPQGGGGRQPIGQQINVRIPPDLLADLKLISDDHGIDLSNVIRMILTQSRGRYVREIRERQQAEGGE